MCIWSLKVGSFIFKLLRRFVYSFIHFLYLIVPELRVTGAYPSNLWRAKAKGLRVIRRQGHILDESPVRAT